MSGCPTTDRAQAARESPQASGIHSGATLWYAEAFRPAAVKSAGQLGGGADSRGESFCGETTSRWRRRPRISRVTKTMPVMARAGSVGVTKPAPSEEKNRGGTNSRGLSRYQKTIEAGRSSLSGTQRFLVLS